MTAENPTRVDIYKNGKPTGESEVVDYSKDPERFEKLLENLKFQDGED